MKSFNINIGNTERMENDNFQLCAANGNDKPLFIFYK